MYKAISHKKVVVTTQTVEEMIDIQIAHINATKGNGYAVLDSVENIIDNAVHYNPLLIANVIERAIKYNPYDWKRLDAVIVGGECKQVGYPLRWVGIGCLNDWFSSTTLYKYAKQRKTPVRKAKVKAEAEEEQFVYLKVPASDIMQYAQAKQ